MRALKRFEAMQAVSKSKRAMWLEGTYQGKYPSWSIRMSGEQFRAASRKSKGKNRWALSRREGNLGTQVMAMRLSVESRQQNEQKKEREREREREKKPSVTKYVHMYV